MQKYYLVGYDLPFKDSYVLPVVAHSAASGYRLAIKQFKRLGYETENHVFYTDDEWVGWLRTLAVLQLSPARVLSVCYEDEVQLPYSVPTYVVLKPFEELIRNKDWSTQRATEFSNKLVRLTSYNSSSMLYDSDTLNGIGLCDIDVNATEVYSKLRETHTVTEAYNKLRENDNA